MKQIKVSEATGPALDWLVAKCEGFVQDDDPAWGPGEEPFAFSTSWEQAGPIIAREGIDLRKRVPDPDIARPHPRFAWKAELVATNPYHCGTGPTPLIAAMRCYVQSKLGETAEVPEELL